MWVIYIKYSGCFGKWPTGVVFCTKYDDKYLCLFKTKETAQEELSKYGNYYGDTASVMFLPKKYIKG